jgi:hypothetical protein
MAETAVAVAAGPPSLVVAPGAFALTDGACSCLAQDCPVPGLHPWSGATWWAELTSTPADIRALWAATSPRAGIVVPTGSLFDALEVSEVAGRIGLARLRHAGVWLGPVIASAGRWSFLVASSTAETDDAAGENTRPIHGEVWHRAHGCYVMWPPSGRGTAAAVRFVMAPSGGDWTFRLPAMDEVSALLGDPGAVDVSPDGPVQVTGAGLLLGRSGPGSTRRADANPGRVVCGD